MKYIFKTKLINDPTYKYNGEEVEVIKKGDYFTTVRFSDNTQADVYTREIKCVKSA